MGQLILANRILIFCIKEFTGRDLQVFADIKERPHGGERFTTLDILYVAFVLTNGQTHLTGGNALFHTQLCQAQGKIF